MTVDAIALRVADALETAGISFMLVGGFSSNEVFRLSDDPHDQERFRRRRQVEIGGHRLYLPAAEDVIIWKLRWARAKDRDDVRAVIGVQQGNLDWPYIEAWCARHGTRIVLDEIRRTVPQL